MTIFDQTPKITYLTRSRAAPRKSSRLGKTPVRKTAAAISSTARKKRRERKLSMSPHLTTEPAVSFLDVDHFPNGSTEKSKIQAELNSENDEDWFSEASTTEKSTITSTSRESFSTLKSRQESHLGIMPNFTYHHILDERRATTPQGLRHNTIISPKTTDAREDLEKHANSSKQQRVESPLDAFDWCQTKSDADNAAPDSSRRRSKLIQRSIHDFGTDTTNEFTDETWEIETLNEWEVQRAPVSRLTASPAQIDTLFKASLTPSSLCRLSYSKGTPFRSSASSTKKSLAFKTPAMLSEEGTITDRVTANLHDLEELSSHSCESDLRKEIEVQSRKIRSLKKKASLLEKQYEAEQLLRSSSEASEVAAMESRNAAIAMLTEVMRSDSNHSRNSASKFKNPMGIDSLFNTCVEAEARESNEEIGGGGAARGLAKAVTSVSMQSQIYEDAISKSSNIEGIMLYLEDYKYTDDVSTKLITEKTFLKQLGKPNDFACSEQIFKSQHALSHDGLISGVQEYRGANTMSNAGTSTQQLSIVEQEVNSVQDGQLIFQISEMRKIVEDLRDDYEKFRRSTTNELRATNNAIQECRERLKEQIAADVSSIKTALPVSEDLGNCCEPYSHSLNTYCLVNDNLIESPNIPVGAFWTLPSTSHPCVSSYNPWKKTNPACVCGIWKNSLMILPKASRSVASTTMMLLFAAFSENEAKVNQLVVPF